ncbi:AI-2E family transporter [Sphingomonas naphthae]|uniref:AI-2E family transporter n=1 Tax=Sphingomonas naphthae TaxID=1813468 RepID=A0ABY7TG02_9SPHN|nr:AI-2E family transporter [Sphingomonas naphthae]WCT71983.1 AI-2E family transporter [Sphingomonas naphthae]
MAEEREVERLIGEQIAGGYRRDRLLAAVAMCGTVGLILAMPFALRAGAEFFLPVTAALVVAIMMVPLLEWLERRGIPSKLAALICLIVFLGIANVAIAAIVMPATDWFALLPQRAVRIRTNLAPVIELYSSLERFVDETANALLRSRHKVRTVTVEQPNSALEMIAASAPYALIQIFFGVLVVYFFLSGWTRMRRHTITARGSFSSAMTTARVIQEVVDATSSYLLTITIINFTLGAMVAAALYFVHMPTPIMWGGIVAIMNYVPYIGPISAALLLATGGLMTFSDPWWAMMPAAIFVGVHLIEANLVTPALVARRLTINPLMILVALSFWGWVWGALGTLLAVPLLIITRTVLAASGKPDVAAFLFDGGTLAATPADEIAPTRKGR